jgi:transcriptional regulator with XRE-family HTH domain
MSYFSTALTRLAEQHEIKQADICRESGLSRAHVSRLFAGDQSGLSDENFIAVLKAFSRHKQAQAELVAARCMDARIGPGAELVAIEIKGANERRVKHGALPQVDLSAETERAFAWLRSQCPLNPELAKHLVGYAKLTGMR